MTRSSRGRTAPALPPAADSARDCPRCNIASSKVRACGFWNRVVVTAASNEAKVSNRRLNTPLAWYSSRTCCQPAAVKPKTGSGKRARATLAAGVVSGCIAGSSATPSKPWVVAIAGGWPAASGGAGCQSMKARARTASGSPLTPFPPRSTPGRLAPLRAPRSEFRETTPGFLVRTT